MSRQSPKVPPLSLSDAQRAVLVGWVRRRTPWPGGHELCWSVRTAIPSWRCHGGFGSLPKTVCTWRRRFLEDGPDGLWDEPRPGVPRTTTDTAVERVSVKTREERPRNATHWSTRSMAAAIGTSQSTVSPIRPPPSCYRRITKCHLLRVFCTSAQVAARWSPVSKSFYERKRADRDPQAVIPSRDGRTFKITSSTSSPAPRGRCAHTKAPAHLDKFVGNQQMSPWPTFAYDATAAPTVISTMNISCERLLGAWLM
ncbi:helix-turn-helix domain-containing protein [Streptomyces sp. NPDC005533]|uniref:helix-turn-helix domain-containing protein n=1 Tax=Streptomyces sp. NPDC005533 TaxID=3364723 RepID=UPI00369BAEBE